MSKHNERCLREFRTGSAGTLAFCVVFSVFAYWGLDAPLIVPLFVLVVTALMVGVGVGAVTTMNDGEERQFSAELDNGTSRMARPTRGASQRKALAAEGLSRSEAHR